jgi:drug/metabolite transporter (DMT)-like permease
VNYFLNLLRDDPGTRRGVAFMFVAVAASVAVMICIRIISSDLHPFVMAFFRSLFGFVVFIPLLMKAGLTPLKTDRIGMHLTRGTLQAALMLVTFMAISLAPLATVTALRFSGPLFATLLALLLLHEIIRMRRITALVIGFTGAMIILRPGIIDINLGGLFAMASAATWAITMIAVKSLSRTESSSAITIYSILVTTPLTFIAALFYWRMPTPEEFFWLVLMGIFGSLSHWCRAQAFKSANISALVPIDFTALIWAATFGYILFGEVADIWTWVGGIVIFSSTMYITYRESQVRTEREKENKHESNPPT